MRFLLAAAVCIVVVGATAFALLSWNRKPPGGDDVLSATGTARTAERSPTAAGIRFRELAKEAGVIFRHIDGRTDMHYVPEIMGGGAAWLDYDGDGYLDLFLVQGSKFPPDPNESPAGPTSCLFRNMGDGTFVDVTDRVGIIVKGFGQGVAAGDYDNDGFPDLCVTCFGHLHLFHNEPDGKGGRRFRDVTQEAGVAADGWCTSAAFGDIHGTGYLDLFVCRYVTMDLKNYPSCFDRTKNPAVRYSCGPREFHGSQSLFFRNNKNGTFTNVSKEAGLEPEGKGLGVLILDLDGDGKTDIFVGNDEMPNHHYRNLGGGKLESCGIYSGIAANGKGRPMGSMGLEAANLTGSGGPDIFITTYYHESTALFRHKDGNLWDDVTELGGMTKASWNKIGWGTCAFDADRDGALDLFVANGHVYRNAHDILDKAEDGEEHTFEQKAQFFRGNGKGNFADVSREVGPYFLEGHVGRGVAMGDYDNDGHMDILINNCGEDAALLHNETQTPYHWIRLIPEGSQPTNAAGSNRDAIGARVTVRAGGKTYVQHVKGGSSYYSSPDRRLLIGLGTAEKVDEVEVRWPNRAASTQKFGPLDVDRSYKLVEGGTAEPANCPTIRKKG